MFFLIFYGSGAVLAPIVYAMYFYNFQNSFPSLASRDYPKDRINSATLALLSVGMGPVSILWTLLLTHNRLGLKWR